MNDRVAVLASSDVEIQFRAFIEDAAFPCVGAKSALAADAIDVISARDIRSGWDDLRIHQHLCNFSQALVAKTKHFRSCAVVFEQPSTLDEIPFENAMWERLQSIQDKDSWLSYTPDERVSRDPNSPDFAFSAGGQGYFVVGMHSRSNRQSRRTPMPVMVFNPFVQFEELRRAGRYGRMSDVIRRRDTDLCGSPNAMLAAHGEAPASRQFSGRQVGEQWRCPLSEARDPPEIAFLRR